MAKLKKAKKKMFSPSGQEKKRKDETYSQNVVKKRALQRHSSEKVCRASALSIEELTQIHQVLYSTTDKLKQDATHCLTWISCQLNGEDLKWIILQNTAHGQVLCSE